KDAIRELHAALGTARVIDLAPRVDRPDELGRVFAATGLVNDAEEYALIDQLLTADGASLIMGRGYANGWTGRVTESIALARVRDERCWSDAARGRLLLSHEPTSEILDLVSEMGLAGQAAFWSDVHASGLEQVARSRSDANGKRADAHNVSALLDALEKAMTAGRFDESRLAP